MSSRSAQRSIAISEALGIQDQSTTKQVEAIAAAREELRALRAEVEHWKRAYNGAMASLADQALKLGQEAHTARVEAEDLMAENAAMRDALTKQRMYAVATGKLTTPSAMHAMMQRMVDDIDDALLRREDERG